MPPALIYNRMTKLKAIGNRMCLSGTVLMLLFLSLADSFAANPPESELQIRQKLSSAILVGGEEQQKALRDLAETGSKAVRDVLTAWPREQLIVYEGAGAKTPAIIED